MSLSVFTLMEASEFCPLPQVLLCRGIPLRDDSTLHLVKTLIWPNSPFDLVLRFAYRRPY